VGWIRKSAFGAAAAVIGIVALRRARS
jgi:hypothetical protein